MNRTLTLGTAAASLAATFVAQPTLLGLSPAILVPGLIDFRPAWNRGISFSLFTQDSDTGRYLLMAMTAVLIAAIAYAAWRWSATRLSAIAYGLVLGGALGNLIDRARFGAVFDFLSLHLGGAPLFVCNLPDIIISAGALLWLADAFLPPPLAGGGRSSGGAG